MAKNNQLVFKMRMKAQNLNGGHQKALNLEYAD